MDMDMDNQVNNLLDDSNIYEDVLEYYDNSDEYKEVMSPTEYRLNNQIQMFGVAYGWDDMKWANETIDFVPDYLKELEKIDNKTVDNFVTFWENKIYN